jgi:G-patch domain
LEKTGVGAGNKALSIMMRMGFKPGQTLGSIIDEAPNGSGRDEAQTGAGSSQAQLQDSKTNALHVPLPLNEWTGAC